MLSCILFALVFSMLAAGPAPAAQTAQTARMMQTLSTVQTVPALQTAPTLQTVPALQTAESLQYQIVPRQLLPTSCGYAVCAAALRLSSGDSGPGNVDERLLLARYGGVGGEEVAERLSLGQMSSILADFDVPSVALKGGLEDAVLPLLALGAPLVIHYERPVQHFVLALGADARQIYVADPADGLTSLSYSEFAHRMSGYLLLPLPFVRSPFGTVSSPMTMTTTSSATAASSTTIEHAISFVKDRNALLGLSLPVSNPPDIPLQKSRLFANFRYGLALGLVPPSLDAQTSGAQTTPGLLAKIAPSISIPFNPQLSLEVESPLGTSFVLGCKVLPLQPEFALGVLYWSSDTSGFWASLDARKTPGQTNTTRRMSAIGQTNTTGNWTFAPSVGHYASKFASPALFVSKLGIGLQMGTPQPDIDPPTDIDPPADIDTPTDVDTAAGTASLPSASHILVSALALRSRLSVEYALIGSLSTSAALVQTLGYAFSGSELDTTGAQLTHFFWDAAVETGVKVPLKNFTLSAGVLIGLTTSAPKGGVYARIQH